MIQYYPFNWSTGAQKLFKPMKRLLIKFTSTTWTTVTFETIAVMMLWSNSLREHLACDWWWAGTSGSDDATSHLRELFNLLMQCTPRTYGTHSMSGDFYRWECYEETHEIFLISRQRRIWWSCSEHLPISTVARAAPHLSPLLSWSHYHHENHDNHDNQDTIQVVPPPTAPWHAQLLISRLYQLRVGRSWRLQVRVSFMIIIKVIIMIIMIIIKIMIIKITILTF